MGNHFSKNVIVVSLMTLVSRFGGLIRDVLMAYMFGTSALKSAFDVAYRIPNLFRRLFGEGALSQALIPVYTDVREKEGAQAADSLATSVAGVVTALLFIIAGLGIAATYAIAPWLGEGSDWQPVMPMLRILLPYAPLICLAAIVMAILNSLKSFAISALAPAFQNLCMIAVLLLACPFISDNTLSIHLVAWSIVFSGVVQVAVQLPALRKRGVPLKLSLRGCRSPAFKRVFKLMMPTAFSAGVFQINVLLDGVLAMWAGAWGPSALGYADRIVYLPLAIVGTAFSTVLLPSLSASYSKRDYNEFSSLFRRTFNSIAVILIPAAVGMIVLAYPIISVIYRGGEFSDESCFRTSAALVAYAAGLLPAGLHKIFVQAFYSREDMKTPFAISVVSVILNLVLNLFFIWILPTEIKPIGIAVATSLSSFISCLIFAVLLARCKEGGVRFFKLSSAVRVLFSSIVASAVMGGVIYAINKAAEGVLPESKLTSAALVGVLVIVGMLVYGVSLRLLAPRLLREMVSLRRQSRRKVES